jgi:hypothetical protein
LYLYTTGGGSVDGGSVGGGDTPRSQLPRGVTYSADTFSDGGGEWMPPSLAAKLFAYNAMMSEVGHAVQVECS